MRSTRRTSRIIDKSGRIEIGCANRLAEDKVELNVDGEDEELYLRLRVYDPQRTMVCERLVRSLPARLAFTARAAGRYEVDVEPLAAPKARPTRTWADWRKDVSGGAQGSATVKQQDGCGHATIEVA